METEKNNYNCSQQDLYSVAKTGWKNYDNHLADFTAYKSSYDANISAEAKKQIKEAQKMPDDQARGAAAEQLRNKVADAADQIIEAFLKLKGYINGAFPEPKDRKPNYEAAGQKYYTKAGQDDWESVSGMAASMNLYIKNNLEILVANNNMPADFQKEVGIKEELFETLYENFKQAEETTEQAVAKIKANNKIHRKLMDMFFDAQAIFRKKPETAEKFNFSNLIDLVNPKVAGIKGDITNPDTNEGEPGVDIKLEKQGQPNILIQTNEDGEYEKLQIPSGDYQITISKSGFETITETITIKTGTVSRRSFVLQKTPQS